MAIVEHQLRRGRAAHPDLLDLLADREACIVLFDQEGGDPARSGLSVGLGIDDQRIRIGRIGDPELRTVEDVTTLHRFRFQLHRDDVRSGRRFGHRQRSDMLAGYQPGQILGLLLFVAPAADLVDAQIRMCAIAESERGARTADFLNRDHMFEIAETQPTIVFVDSDAMQAELAHRLPQLCLREIVFAVDLLCQRSDLLVGEPTDAVADHLRALAELEIEFGGCAHSAVVAFQFCAAPISACARHANRVLSSARKILPAFVPCTLCCIGCGDRSEA